MQIPVCMMEDTCRMTGFALLSHGNCQGYQGHIKDEDRVLHRVGTMAPTGKSLSRSTGGSYRGCYRRRSGGPGPNQCPFESRGLVSLIRLHRLILGRFMLNTGPTHVGGYD